MSESIGTREHISLCLEPFTSLYTKVTVSHLPYKASFGQHQERGLYRLHSRGVGDHKSRTVTTTLPSRTCAYGITQHIRSIRNLPTATSCPLRTAVPRPHRAELITASGIGEHCFSLAETSKSLASQSSFAAAPTLSLDADEFASAFPPVGDCGQNFTEMRTRLSFKMAIHTKVFAETKATISLSLNSSVELNSKKPCSINHSLK